VTIWIGRNRNALRIGILVAAFLVLLLWSQPTAWVVLGLALIVGLLHLLVEVLGRAPPARTGNDAGSPAGRVP
jgi:Flp pilus assembly protein TadB